MLKLKSMRIFFILCLIFSPLVLFSEESIVKDEARAYREEGYRLQQMGDLSGALQYYQKAAQIDPHYAEVFNDLGVVYESMGDDTNALSMHKKVLEIAPDYTATYTNLAFLYERTGDIENATLYWKKRY